MHKLTLLLLFSAGTIAQAASFDCRKATTSDEKAICASPELSAADEEMGRAYKTLLAAASPEFTAEVREDQLAWIKQRTVICKFNETQSSEALQVCLKTSIDSRTKALRSSVVQAGGTTFFWRSISVNAPAGPSISDADNSTHTKGTLNASWPQAKSATPEWKAWNAAIQVTTRSMASLSAGKPGGDWDPQWAEGIDAEITTSLGVVSERLVTATVNNYWDGHGAHPNESSVELNWLLQEKRELRAEDVFRADSGWDKVIQARCDAALSKQLGPEYAAWMSPGEMPKALHAIIVESKNWGLDDHGLTIVFQDYSVSPHCCRADPVTVPWGELQSYLKPGFTPPGK